MNGKTPSPIADGADLYVSAPEASAAEQVAETAHARRLAERYRLSFVDLSQFSIDHELFRAIPADLMLRYGFVPYRREGNALVVVVSDPTDLPMIDEIGRASCRERVGISVWTGGVRAQSGERDGDEKKQ